MCLVCAALGPFNLRANDKGELPLHQRDAAVQHQVDGGAALGRLLFGLQRQHRWSSPRGLRGCHQRIRGCHGRFPLRRCCTCCVVPFWRSRAACLWVFPSRLWSRCRPLAVWRCFDSCFWGPAAAAATACLWRDGGSGFRSLDPCCVSLWGSNPSVWRQDLIALWRSFGDSSVWCYHCTHPCVWGVNHPCVWCHHPRSIWGSPGDISAGLRSFRRCFRRSSGKCRRVWCHHSSLRSRRRLRRLDRGLRGNPGAVWSCNV